MIGYFRPRFFNAHEDAPSTARMEFLVLFSFLLYLLCCCFLFFRSYVYVPIHGQVLVRVTLRCRVELASLRFEVEREAFYHARDSSADALEDQAEENIADMEEQEALRGEREVNEGKKKGEAADDRMSLPMVTLEEELMDLVAIHR